MRKLLKVALITLLCTLFVAACSSSRKNNENTSVPTKESKEKVVQTETTSSDDIDVTGIYLGKTGSAITLFEDGTADYFWTGFEGVYSDNSWSYKDGVITVHIDLLKCDVTADVPNGDPSSLLFVSDSKNWDDEEFERTSDKPQKLTATAYRKMFDDDTKVASSDKTNDAFSDVMNQSSNVLEDAAGNLTDIASDLLGDTTGKSSSTSKYSSYEDIYNDYSKRIRDATPGLIEEYKQEAAKNNAGINGLAEISNSKVSDLAEISNDGVSEMADFMMHHGSGDYSEYESWAGKLYDVYME